MEAASSSLARVFIRIIDALSINCDIVDLVDEEHLPLLPATSPTLRLTRLVAPIEARRTGICRGIRELWRPRIPWRSSRRR